MTDTAPHGTLSAAAQEKRAPPPPPSNNEDGEEVFAPSPEEPASHEETNLNKEETPPQSITEEEFLAGAVLVPDEEENPPPESVTEEDFLGGATCVQDEENPPTSLLDCSDDDSFQAGIDQDDPNDKQVVLVDGVPVLALSPEEVDAALESRQLNYNGTLDDKREALQKFEREKNAVSGGAAKPQPDDAVMPEYPTDVDAAGVLVGDEVIHASYLMKRATSGNFFSSLAMPQKRWFVLAARRFDPENASTLRFLLSYFKKQDGTVINTWIIDSVCVLEDLAVAEKKQPDSFLLTSIQGHPKTRLLAKALSREDHHKWITSLSRVISGEMLQEVAASIRASNDVVQFQTLVDEMLIAVGEAADTDAFYSRTKQAFEAADWGAKQVQFQGNTLDPSGQVAALKKLVAEMKQYETTKKQAEEAQNASPRQRRATVSRRKSGQKRNTFA